MKSGVLLCGVVLLTACTSAPSIDISPEAELSFDGLSPISHSRFANAWIDPEVDLTDYDKIMTGNAEFEFRAVKERASRVTMRNNNQTEFWISDENKQKLIDMTTAIFNEELQNSEKFSFVEEPGPDTLILVGGMHDIVSRVLPQSVGRTEVFLSSVGEATLVLELRDSLSGETIYRAVDRRTMNSQRNIEDVAIRANSVTTWAEVRRLARRWATRLREGLDSMHE